MTNFTRGNDGLLLVLPPKGGSHKENQELCGFGLQRKADPLPQPRLSPLVAVSKPMGPERNAAARADTRAT